MYNIIDEYCFKSKNLYNYANYIVRQSFIKEDKYIPYNELTKQIKHSDPFKNIGSNSGQHTLKYLHLNWKSFFVGIKDWKINKFKYLGKPQIPNYLPKEGRYIWILTNLQSKIKDGYLFFSFKPLKPFNNLIRTNIKDKIMQTRIIPYKRIYILEIVYEKPISSIKEENERIAGIDLGLDRFATIYTNLGFKPIAINGGGIKSINNFYNKEMAKYKGILDKVNNLKSSKRLDRINIKRKNKIENFLHKASKFIVNYCVSNDINIVVIGYNSKWKQNIRIGINNQHFTYIPYYNFLNKLSYKLEEVGIKLIKTEESYTSKASFIDNDDMTRGKFSGERIERGLYKSKSGVLINADVNGAANIIRKVFPNAFANGIKGVDFHPSIINIL